MPRTLPTLHVLSALVMLGVLWLGRGAQPGPREFPDAPEMPGRIVYARDESAYWNIFVSEANGTDERRLTNYEESIWQERVRWAEDGELIVFDVLPGNATYKLFTLDPNEGGEPAELPIEGSSTDPAVKPQSDGLVLALAHREPKQVGDLASHDVMLWTEASSELQPLAATPGVDERGPDWSPSGDLIVFERRDAERRGDWDLWVMNSDGSDPRPLIVWPGSHERMPRWSRDGTRIAFITGATPLGLGSLQVLDVETGTTEGLIDQADGPVSWSPDGNQLLFHSPFLAGPAPIGDERPAAQSTPDNAGMGLYTVDIHTREIRRLRDGAGGRPEESFLGGYAPDWLAPSPTPTPTATATPTASPTPTPTSLFTPRKTAWLPVALSTGDLRSVDQPSALASE